MIETAFVTPHAVRQFQERIRNLDYDAALTAIIRGLREDALSPRLSECGVSSYVRVRGRKHGGYDFRAVIKPGEAASLPVVVTILKGGKTRGRLGKKCE